MHFAINTPNFDLYSDARLLAELAHEAEEAGWDGFFVWDHIGAGPEWPAPIADPWVALVAMAMTTRRIKIGPIVTPLPRRRPWKVAREAVTLDHLSQGRLILGVGIGSDQGREFSCFGEATDDKLHASSDLIETYVHRVEHFGRNPTSLCAEAQQQVLGTNVVVVHAPGFLGGEQQHLLGPLGELLEPHGARNLRA